MVLAQCDDDCGSGVSRTLRRHLPCLTLLSRAEFHWLVRLVASVCFVVLTSPAQAAEDEAIQRSMSLILGHEVLQLNGRDFLKNTLLLPEPERFEALSGWVLPAQESANIRLSCEYESQREFRAASPPVESSRRPRGGFLSSPALHLVDLALRLDRMEELRAKVQARQVAGEVQERKRIALMTMIEIKRGDFPEALKWMEALEVRLAKETFARFQDRWPETLVLTEAVGHAELEGITESMLNKILIEQVHRGTHCGPVQWDRHMAALVGTLRMRQQAGQTLQGQAEITAEPARSEWIPVSGCDEATRALAMPALHWQRTGNQFVKRIGHQDDYLMYQIPLQGDFTIEADTSGFDHRETQLVIGGHWLTPHHTLDQFESGDLRGVNSAIPLTPKMSMVSDWVRQRAVVRDGMCESAYNGRLIQTNPVRKHQFPWVAVRSPFFANGVVRNVHITGSPEVPSLISMSSDPDLSGWVRFHLDRVCGVEPDWDFAESPDSDGEIVASRKVRFQDTFQESLLRYLRPMVEDGEIEYEFYYSTQATPDAFHVHPALDQMVILIEPEQVSLHQATNGIHDPSGLGPLNRTTVSPGVPCPLINGWNQLKLKVIGDDVHVVLNGTPVYQGTIPIDNDRTFGLFHFADQTAVRVRNMHWTGSWPKSLPPIAEQELASHELDDLEAQVAQFTHNLVYDFEEHQRQVGQAAPLTYSEKTFQFQSSDQLGAATLTAVGLEMTRPGTAAFTDTWVAPRTRITGDFDIQATFEKLETATPTHGTNAIYLIVVTDDEETTHSRVWHGVYAHPNIELRHATQAEFNRYGKGRPVNIEFNGVTSEDCTSGRLRVVRLGKRMTFMIAEQDSQLFRVIHSADVTDAPVRFDGIRLGSGNWGHESPDIMATRVLWKRLVIRTRNRRVADSE